MLGSSCTDVSSWSDWGREIPLRSKGCGSDLLIFLFINLPSHMEMIYSNCLLQRWNYVRLSFLTQNDVLKGWKCGADSRTLITLSPLEQRFEPWPPEFPVDAIISGHHILKASLFHITDLKKYLDLVKLKCCFFILRKGVSASNFPCFFQMYHFSC